MLHYITYQVGVANAISVEFINEFFKMSFLLFPDENSNIMTGASTTLLDHEESLTIKVKNKGWWAER